MLPSEYQKIYDLENSHWWFKGRWRIILTVLNKLLPNNRTLEILDIGCGCGLGLFHLGRFGNVKGIDISSVALRFCQQRRHENLVQAQGERLPFCNNSFDLITAFDSIEHIERDILALEEIYRVSKREGLVVLTVPAHQFLYSSHDRVVKHIRRYSVRDIKTKIAKAGFSIYKASYFNMFLFPLISLIRIVNKSVSFKKKSDLYFPIPKIFNSLLYFILKLEAFIISRRTLPLGISIIIVTKK